ncbi:MAG TPA: metallophosphoesterase family protein [Patescibacteria group bacterium]
MQIAVFSDTHLTDKFEPQLYQALKKMIESADQVIINGDFWDGFLVSFDAFVNSKWKQLFPLFKKKNTIYIYGNHDPEHLCDDRVSLFSVTQTLHHDLKVGKYLYKIQHGHLVHQSIITNSAALFPPAWITSLNVWIKQHEVEGTRFGQLTARIEKYFDQIGDKKLQVYVRKVRAGHPNVFYIFGHTHILNFLPNDGYLNPGSFTALTPRYICIEDAEHPGLEPVRRYNDSVFRWNRTTT